MKIYTKTGDDGTTGLFGGPRVPKDDPRIEAYGTVDELNSSLGLVRSVGLEPEIDALLDTIQHDLFSMGAQLASPDPSAMQTDLISEADCTRLEAAIDHFEKGLEPLATFILPGGTPAAAHLHLARTVCRRAERRLLTFMHAQKGLATEPLVYLNRLSDLLFVLARAVNHLAGKEDVRWRGR